MAKQSGLGDQLFVQGFDVAGDIQSIQNLSTPRATLPMTAINKEAQERSYGLADAQGEFTSFFNDADDQVFEALKSLPRTDVGVMYLRGSGLGRPAFAVQAKQTNYDGTRGDDGSLLFSTAVLSSKYAGDWCVQLTAGKETDSAAGNGTSVDLGTGSLAFGFQAYLHVFSIGSGTPSVKIQTSSDDGVGDPFADLTDGSFGAVAAQTSYRIASSSETATVERYVRVVTTGTFTNLVFAVGFNRNQGLRTVS